MGGDTLNIDESIPKKKRSKYLAVPGAFDLSRYDALEHIPNRLLAGLLERRRQLWFGVVHTTEGNLKQMADEETERAIALVDSLLLHPLQNPAALPIFKNKDRITGLLVSEPSANELQKYLEAFGEFKLAAASQNHDLVFPESDPEGKYLGTITTNHMRSIFPARFKHPELLVKISLDARDDDLLKSFEAFLQDARRIRRMPAPNDFESETTEGTKRKILRHKSIPYIDLMIWSKLRNAKIKTTLLADTLFPYSHYDSIEGPRHIRERTDRYADKALSSSFVQSLAP